MNNDYIHHLINKLDNNYLVHYASEYYDPAKAHEYYMKNRKLKGRSTSSLSDDGKDIWETTKSNIDNEKKTKIMEANLNKEIASHEAKIKAESIRRNIVDKLKKLNDSLNAKYKTDSDKLTEELKVINNDKSLTKEQKEKKRQEIYAKRKALSANRKTESNNNSETIKAERTKIVSDLKSAIQNARDTYTNKKNEITNSYEDTYQQEYDKIKSEYQKDKTSKSKKSNKKKR